MALDITDAQIDIIRSSFNKVLPIADQAAVLFYDRLFETTPEVKPLFHAADMAQQRVKD